jgi:hypothetical protein
MVRGILKRLPIEYLYGLRRVELRAREEEVGCPYAWYIPDERAIILFSLPMEWELGFGVDLIDMRDIFHAEVSELDGRWFIRWPDPELRAMWFYAAVFGHELGHHHLRKRTWPISMDGDYGGAWSRIFMLGAGVNDQM